MDRLFHLLVATAIATLIGLPSAAAAEDGTCTTFQINADLCNVDAALDDGAATLEGSLNSPGSGSSPSSDGGAAEVDCSRTPLFDDRCFGVGPGRPAPVQPVTLADIAQFRPRPGVDSMEPNGWMIVGLDTNFFATATSHVLDGSLLGQPASVRFTPVVWHWSYGDGATLSSGTAGAPWAVLGSREFDPTATSHIYRKPGTYFIDLTIDFGAEYRFAGGGWTPIAGLLPVPANRLTATAGSAKTVLVEHDCNLQPTGPGC